MQIIPHCELTWVSEDLDIPRGSWSHFPCDKDSANEKLDKKESSLLEDADGYFSTSLIPRRTIFPHFCLKWHQWHVLVSRTWHNPWGTCDPWPLTFLLLVPEISSGLIWRSLNGRPHGEKDHYPVSPQSSQWSHSLMSEDSWSQPHLVLWWQLWLNSTGPRESWEKLNC